MSGIGHEEPFDPEAFAAALAPAEGRPLFVCDIGPHCIGIEMEHEPPGEPRVRFRGIRYGPDASFELGAEGIEASGEGASHSAWSGWFPVADAPIHLEIDLFDWGEE